MAQLPCVAYLHHTLHVYPCLWLTTHVQPEFFHVDLRTRSFGRYLPKTPQVVATAILWTMVLPTLFTKMFNGVDCDAQVDDVRVTTERGSFVAHVRRDDRACTFALFLTRPTDVARYGIIPLMTVFAFWFIFRTLITPLRREQIATRLGNTLFPNIMLNGLGPKELRSLQKKHQRLEHEQQVPRVASAYDFLQPFDMIVISFLLCAVFPVFMSFCGAVIDGASGFFIGISVGFVSARFSLPILNWWFGAGEEFMTAIHEELAEYQPLRRYLTNENDPKPNKDTLKKEVDSCALKFQEHVKDLPPEKKQEANKVATEIKQEGLEVLVTLMNWILKDPKYDSRPVGKLLNARRSCMTVTERSLAVLSFLNLRLFLMYYFDQGGDFVPHFIADSGRLGSVTWKDRASVYHLKELYITWPYLRVCVSEKNAIFWKVILSTSKKSLEEDDTILNYAAKVLTDGLVAIEKYAVKDEGNSKSLEEPLLPV
jgi:hypothetical protein